MAVARKKTTVYLDPELLRSVKVLEASTGRHDYEILEDALRRYVATSRNEASRQALRNLLGQLGGQSDLSEEAALDLAYSELHASRQARRRGCVLRVVRGHWGIGGG
jgi:hypothetical protein